MPEPAFVTGGTGFVGGALLRRLVADGRVVRALARTEVAASAIVESGAEPVAGDVFDVEALRQGMRGCEIVFHVAGVNAMCARDPSEMLRVNVEGSETVVRAAAASGVRRVVFTSSAATIGEPAGVVGREGTPHRGWFLSEYERSKFLAEERVMQIADELGIDLMSVNPSSVQGPGRTGGSARLLLELVDKRLPLVMDAYVSIVDIDDCTDGHVLASESGLAGERYVLNGATLTTRQAVALVRSVAGRPRRSLRVPRAAAPVMGRLGDRISRASGRDLPLCPELVRTLLHGHRYDGSRAARELGLVYRPIEETVARTLRWYADEELIRPIPLVGSRR